MTELSEDSTIHTVIEDDAAYRTRLKAIVKAIGNNIFVDAVFDLATGDALDEIGAKCRVYRIFTHTCRPMPKSEVA